MEKAADDEDPSTAGGFRLEAFLPYRLSIAAKLVSQLIVTHYFAAEDLAIPEWRLLAAVGCHTVLSPTAAGELTSMDKVRVSRAAARLVARGLLKQTQNPADGRGRHLRLTRKGVAIYLSLPHSARAAETDLARSLTKTEWTVLQRALDKIGDHARTMLAGAPRAAPVACAPAPKARQ